MVQFQKLHGNRKVFFVLQRKCKGLNIVCCFFNQVKCMRRITKIACSDPVTRDNF